MDKFTDYYNILNSIDSREFDGTLTISKADEYRNKAISEANMSEYKSHSEQLNRYLEENGYSILFEDDRYTIIHEEDVFTWRDTGNLKVSLRVDGDGRSDRGFDKDPYFKIYMGKNYVNRDKSKSTRISFTEPSYRIHLGEKWNLTSGELKDLDTFLRKKNKEGITNWEILCNKAIEVAKNKDRIQSLLPDDIPKYYKGMPEKKLDE